MVRASKTVLLLFSRSAAAEAKHKRALAPRPKQREQIAQALVAHAQQIARASGLPYVQIDEGRQWGKDFGSRFDHAIRQLFDEGYERVIAIGNDCLALQARHLQEAARLLQEQSVVLGPATDGGFYLMGFRRKAYQQLSLTQLPWQQTQLQTALYEKLHQQQLDYHRLAELADADELSAVKHYALSHSGVLSAVLRSIIASLRPEPGTKALLLSLLDQASTTLRGPPARR